MDEKCPFTHHKLWVYLWVLRLLLKARKVVQSPPVAREHDVNGRRHDFVLCRGRRAPKTLTLSWILLGLVPPLSMAVTVRGGNW